MSEKLSPEEAEEILRPCYVPSRRFTIQQGEKEAETIDGDGRVTSTTVPNYRSVDDLSEPGLNDTVTQTEKPTTEGVDSILAMIRLVMSAIDWKTRRVSIRLSDGRVLSGDLHEG